MKKIAIVHAYFEVKGGGERMMIALAKHLHADIFTGFWLPSSFSQEGITVHNLNVFSKILGWRTIKLAFAMRKYTKLLQTYDTVILSGQVAVFTIENCPKNVIYYCHTPPRYIYDQYTFFKNSLSFFQRLLFILLVVYMKPRYEKYVSCISTILTNSNHVRSRIKKYLNKDSEVIYPPNIIPKEVQHTYGKYYFSFARLDSLKRIERIIEAFQQMPNKKLIIASTGPIEVRCKMLANNCSNITFIGTVSDEKLHQLILESIATIYIPRDEDFGMSVIESMAYGKPVIGVAEGGLLETIDHKETGYLCPKNLEITDLIDAISYMTSEVCHSMFEACRKNAFRYDEKVFFQKIDSIVKAYENI